ncbi:MAG: YceD family protein [Clostridia bacterium]
MGGYMELNFTRISRSEGIKEKFDMTDHLDDSTIEFCGERLNIVSPVTVKGSAVNYEGKISVDLRITAQVERTCSRCLENFKEEVQVDSNYVFVKDAKDDEEDYYTFKSDKVDITDLVLGDIAAKLAMKPLCKEDCKGLCPMCGKNKNSIDCQCKSEEIDPRMQALSKLLDRK